jgi:outer membrane beta-barrel protein
MKKLLFVVALLSITASTAWGQSKDAGQNGSAAAAGADRGSDKLDLKNLEDKYWSAKDTDFSVVQNRTYTKDKRFFTSLSYGPMLNDPYSTGRMTDVSAGYYFSERWGVELAYEQGSLTDNDSTKQFFSQNKFAPNYNRFRNYTSVNVLFVPFYAKMSFMDKKIVYFDIQFAAGVGQMNYQIQTTTGNTVNTLVDASQNKSAFGYNLDVTQQLFFSQHLAFRLDIKNKWSTQKEMRYFPAGGDPDLGSRVHQDTTLLLGLNIFY